MRDRDPSAVVLVLSGASYLRMGEHESRTPSSNSQKKRGPWQGEQGVQSDSTRRRSEVRPGLDLGHSISTLWLCDSAGSEMRESRGASADSEPTWSGDIGKFPVTNCVHFIFLDHLGKSRDQWRYRDLNTLS